MRFMQAYKRLDALCRDMNGIGVTGYIEDMRKTVNGSLHVSGWNADFQRLKYYRHIRNQIAHEVDVTEEEMCSPRMLSGLKNFTNVFFGKQIRWQCIIRLPAHRETPDFQQKKLSKLRRIRPIPLHHHDLPKTQYQAILWC